MQLRTYEAQKCEHSPLEVAGLNALGPRVVPV